VFTGQIPFQSLNWQYQCTEWCGRLFTGALNVIQSTF